jgi:DNA-binding response OmpR family regulator
MANSRQSLADIDTQDPSGFDDLEIVDRHRILIVENMPLQAEQLRRDLESFAYAVESISTGVDAFEVLQTKPTRYALVLASVNLPDMDGHRLLRAIRSEKALERLPVIFLSFFQDSRVSEAAFNLGAIDVLGKPYRLDELKVRVNNMIALAEYEKLMSVEQAVLSSELVMKNFEVETKNQSLEKANEQLKTLQSVVAT